MGRQNRRNKNVQLQYLTIFENQILCLKTDGDWYFNCGTLKFNEKCEVCLFIKRFEELHEIAVKHYLQKERGILRIIQKGLVTTRKHYLKKWRSRRDFNKRIPV